MIFRIVRTFLKIQLLQEWSNCGFNPKLSFPNANPFIPTDFNLYPIEPDVQKIPIIIHDTPVMRVWFKQDTEFLKPKVIMNFDFSSPLGKFTFLTHLIYFKIDLRAEVERSTAFDPLELIQFEVFVCVACLASFQSVLCSCCRHFVCLSLCSTIISRTS